IVATGLGHARAFHHPNDPRPRGLPPQRGPFSPSFFGFLPRGGAVCLAGAPDSTETPDTSARTGNFFAVLAPPAGWLARPRGGAPRHWVFCSGGFSLGYDLVESLAEDEVPTPHAGPSGTAGAPAHAGNPGGPRAAGGAVHGQPLPHDTRESARHPPRDV